MKKLLALCATVVVALAILVCAPLAHAATDVTGAWNTTVTTPNGDMQITFTFKQDGAKLTGTSAGPMGDPSEISNGKVDGDKLSFDVTFNGMTIHHEGTVTGDDIKMTASSDQFPAMEMTLKRVKQ